MDRWTEGLPLARSAAEALKLDTQVLLQLTQGVEELLLDCC